MYCINEARVLGYVGLVKVSGERDRATFTVATTRAWRDTKSGEAKEETDWHYVVVWAPPEGLLSRLTKGARVIVDGRLRTREYDAGDGSRRKAVEIVAKPARVEVIAPPPDRQAAGGGTSWNATPPPRPDDDAPY